MDNATMGCCSAQRERAASTRHVVTLKAFCWVKGPDLKENVRVPYMKVQKMQSTLQKADWRLPECGGQEEMDYEGAQGNLGKLFSAHLPQGLAVPPLGDYPREKTAYFHIKTCAQMFTVAVSVTAPNGNQLRCPSTGWLKDRGTYILRNTTQQKQNHWCM